MDLIPYARDTCLLPILEPSQVGDAKRRIVALADALGFGETQCGRIAIAVSELATNILLHATSGYLLVRQLEATGGLEVLAVDRGRGMENVDVCLRDGFSTNGTAGNGLGAARRMSQVFDIYSRPGLGTVVLVQFRQTTAIETAPFTVGGVCVALAGEIACGDAWGTYITPGGRIRAALIDGLGHGTSAALAASSALQLVESNLGLPLIHVLDIIHRGITATVGTAMAICEIDLARSSVDFIGIGNISGFISTADDQRSLVSHNGIVGYQMEKLQQYSYVWKKGSMLTMYSDGLAQPTAFGSMPGLQRRHPALIAAVLHRDFGRSRDDVTCLVVREPS
jgi:anti-sigma regulatory factor (Ser/Thr protein kinase)